MSKKNDANINNQESAGADEPTIPLQSLSKEDLTVAKSEGAEQPLSLTRRELFEANNDSSDSAVSEEETAESEQSQSATSDESSTSETPSPESATPATRTANNDDGGATPPDHPRHGLFGNGKMFLAGIGLLVLAGGMFVFLWNHAKVTQAESISASQKLLSKIFTSPAQRDITSFASKDSLEQLQHSVGQMAQSKEKDQLQKQHDVAADMVTIRSGYVDLYNTHHRFSSDAQPNDIKQARADMRKTNIYQKKTEPYFTKKYQTKLAYADRVIKHAINRHKAVQKLYRSSGKLKSKYASYDITDLLLTLKYSKQSELEHSDRSRLISSRKHLYKVEAQQRAAEASSAAAESALEAAQSSLIAAQQSSSDSSSSSETSSTSSTSSETSSSSDSSYSIISSTPTTNAENSSSTTTPTTGGDGIYNNTTNGSSSGRNDNGQSSSRSSSTTTRRSSSSTYNR